MDKNPMNKGILTENAVGIGTVTRGMVSKVDWEQAKGELTGGLEMDAEEIALESIPESERWDPVPGSIGHQVQDALGEDEDSEGRSESTQLVEEGSKEAEHDQMLQAAQAAREEDRRDA